MAKRYVEVERKKLEDFLRTCGFDARVQGNEVVYIRPNHQCPSLVVKVYTSRPTKAETVRACGQDAIRVTAAYENQKTAFKGRKSFGIFKATRTYRTGSEEAILERLYQRMQEAYRETNIWVRVNWEQLLEAHLIVRSSQSS